MMLSRRFLKSSFRSQLCRRNLSSGDDVAVKLRDARLKRINSQASAGENAERAAVKSSPLQKTVLSFAVVGAVIMASIEVHKNKDGALGKVYWGSPVQLALSWLYERTYGQFQEIYMPSSDKLIPDWGDKTVYGDIPPGTPAPPLLILDVERTLIGTIYDAKTGFKHVKRPGADELIRQLGSYYEVVLFSENDIGAMDSVLVALDKDGRCHKLGSHHAEKRGDVMLKRLDYINRDIRKIIVIDDDENAVSLSPRNALIVKPYTNVYDKEDRVLFDLIPLLQGIVQENASDFRTTLEDLGTRDAEEAATEYLMRKNTDHISIILFYSSKYTYSVHDILQAYLKLSVARKLSATLV